MPVKEFNTSGKRMHFQKVRSKSPDNVHRIVLSRGCILILTIIVVCMTRSTALFLFFISLESASSCLGEFRNISVRGALLMLDVQVLYERGIFIITQSFMLPYQCVL